MLKNRAPIQPPHCQKTPIVIAQNSRNIQSAIQRGMQMQFYIGLHTSVCFRLHEGLPLASTFLEQQNQNQTSWLHTIKLEKLEQHYTVTQKYKFGIPEVSTDCICECEANGGSCNSQAYQYTSCPHNSNEDKSSTCYRTFFPNQTPIGCSEDSTPSLCCEVRFRPYKNMTYVAVKLDQPQTIAFFKYTAYDYVNGRWIEMDSSTVTSNLDGAIQDHSLDRSKRVSLSVSAGGRAAYHLSGMYFAEDSNGGEPEELREQSLNEINDNNFDRLGWYRRKDDEGFHVNNGIVRMDDIHKAKVKNCKEQTYQTYLNANHYMPGHFNLSSMVKDRKPWVKSAQYNEGKRVVVVSHAQGTSLHINLHVSDELEDHSLVFFHNASRIQDFSGSIIVDGRSNRYFNLTVYEASGKIDGAIKFGTARSTGNVHTFTTYVSDLQASNRSMIVPLPGTIDQGPKMICLKADETRDEDSICRIIDFHEVPLEIDLIEGKWHELVGSCPNCNQVNFNGVLKFLNPAQWIKGITSLGDGVMLATDLVVYLGVLIIVYLLITKLVLPIVQCFMCPISCATKGRK